MGFATEVLQGIDQRDFIVINPPDSLENGEQVTVSQNNDPAPDPK